MALRAGQRRDRLGPPNPRRAAFLYARKDLERELAWNVTWPPELLDELAGIGAPEVGPGAEAVLSLPLLAELAPDERAALAADPQLLGMLRHIYESDGFALFAARELLREDPPDFAAVYTSGVDNVSHRFHQQGVVDRYYEYVDGLLSGLVEAAGPLASFVVVSDHGFEYEDPERLAHEHGPDGILILSGPAFRAGAHLERTPVLVDVAPTVLALLGLPLAETLAGAPVLEAFAPESRAARPPAAVASYGAYAPPTGPALETPDDLQDEVMEKLRALGYVAE